MGFDLMAKLEAKFKKQVYEKNSLDLHDFFKSQISPILRWFVCAMCYVEDDDRIICKVVGFGQLFHDSTCVFSVFN